MSLYKESEAIVAQAGRARFPASFRQGRFKKSHNFPTPLLRSETMIVRETSLPAVAHVPSPIKAAHRTALPGNLQNQQHHTHRKHPKAHIALIPFPGIR
jgi:hypothetical protein